MDQLLFRNETYRIRQALFEVYKRLGTGLLESVYQEALEKEFSFLDIPYISQYPQTVQYREEKLKASFKFDFLCYKSIIIEIKAVKELTEIHRAQLLNYLRLSKKTLGLLVNFSGYPRLVIERLALSI